MCCCFRPEAATLGRREAAGAGPRDRAPPSPARPGCPAAHPAGRLLPAGGSSCVRAPPAPYARFSRGRVASAPGALGARDPPAGRPALPTLTAPGCCPSVFRLGSPTPKAPVLRGSHHKLRASPVRGEPRTSLPECSRSPRSVPTRGLQAAAGVSAPVLETPGPAK